MEQKNTKNKNKKRKSAPITKPNPNPSNENTNAPPSKKKKTSNSQTPPQPRAQPPTQKTSNSQTPPQPRAQPPSQPPSKPSSQTQTPKQSRSRSQSQLGSQKQSTHSQSRPQSQSQKQETKGSASSVPANINNTTKEGKRKSKKKNKKNTNTNTTPEKPVQGKESDVKEPQKEIKEGKVVLQAGSANPGVLGFYNPQMRFNRDLSVLLLSLKSHPNWKVLDSHASSGILAMRWAKEVSKTLQITANDVDPNVLEILKNNVAHSKLENKIRITQEDTNVLLHQESYDYIHLDPYGTSAIYFDAAFCSLRNGGILTITSTDLTGICGTFPNVALRNYGGITNEKVPFKRELGARVVLAAAARSAARYGKGIEPLYTFMRPRNTHSFNKEHYLCLAIRVHNGVKPADETLSKIKRIYVEVDGEISIGKSVGQTGNELELGPAWCGTLGDSELIKSFVGMVKANDSYDQAKTLLDFLKLMKTELLFRDLMFYHKVTKIVGKEGKMPVERLIVLLKENGFLACKTHWDKDSVKTNASLTKTKQIIIDHQNSLKQPFTQ